VATSHPVQPCRPMCLPISPFPALPRGRGRVRVRVRVRAGLCLELGNGKRGEVDRHRRQRVYVMNDINRIVIVRQRVCIKIKCSLCVRRPAWTKLQTRGESKWNESKCESNFPYQKYHDSTMVQWLNHG